MGLPSEAAVDAALVAAGWLHTPHDDDVVGTNYAEINKIKVRIVGETSVPVHSAPFVPSGPPFPLYCSAT